MENVFFFKISLNIYTILKDIDSILKKKFIKKIKVSDSILGLMLSLDCFQPYDGTLMSLCSNLQFTARRPGLNNLLKSCSTTEYDIVMNLVLIVYVKFLKNILMVHKYFMKFLSLMAKISAFRLNP